MRKLFTLFFFLMVWSVSQTSLADVAYATSPLSVTDPDDNGEVAIAHDGGRCSYIDNRWRCNRADNCEWNDWRNRCERRGGGGGGGGGDGHGRSCYDIWDQWRCERRDDCRWSWRRDRCVSRWHQ